MASQNGHAMALQSLFRTSTDLIQAFAPEKPPSLLGEILT